MKLILIIIGIILVTTFIFGAGYIIGCVITYNQIENHKNKQTKQNNHGKNNRKYKNKN